MLTSLKAVRVALNRVVVEVRSGHSFSFVLGLCMKGKRGVRSTFLLSWSAYVLSLEALITDIYCLKKEKKKKKERG